MEDTGTILLLPEPTGEFMVEGPPLPECFRRGQTRLAAVGNAEEALGVHLKAMGKPGERIPWESATLPVQAENLAEGPLYRASLALAETLTAEPGHGNSKSDAEIAAG